jgi:hypothetical protein
MRKVIPILFLSTGVLTAGDPPPSAPPPVTRTYRDIEVPREPATVRRYVPVDEQVPQPPRRLREYTETRSYTVDLDAAPPVHSCPTAVPAYKVAPPVTTVSRYAIKEVAVPVPEVHYVAVPHRTYVPVAVAAPPLRYGAPLGYGVYNTPSGRPAAPGIFSAPGAPFPLDGPVRRGIRAGLGYDY